MFIKYQHLERLGSSETDGILGGTCYIFYKIDGTNGSIWYDEEIKTGSRNRELSLESDNAGFCQWILNQNNIKKFFESNPNLRLYGEWLVPHSLKTYRDDAWRDFYVFDVVIDGETPKYLPYEEYKVLLEEYGINYIPPIAKITNPQEIDLLKLLEKTGQFLVKNGEGLGEGLVVKNYSFYNKYGRQVWAKMITNEFKEKAHKEMGAPELNGTLLLEQKIVDEFLTEAFIQKEKAKIENQHGWTSKQIPQLLDVVWYEFIKEEVWEFIKKYKNPRINFKLLNSLCIRKTKEVVGI